MKRLFATLLLISVITFCIGAVERPFLEDYYHPRSIIAAFTRDAIGNHYGDIDFQLRDKIVITHLESLNQLAEEFRIVDLVQMHDNVTNLDWNENGVHLQNIYRIVLEKNDNIEAALSAVSKDKNIIWAEYESINRPLYTPNDPEYSSQWHHPAIFMPETWEYVRGTKEVVIAITDSGVKWNHPDLADNIWISEAELPGITINWQTGQILGGNAIDDSGRGRIDDVIGWDFVENNNNPYQNFPGNEHGTHVAGCAGAVGDNGIGVAGVALTVSLMSCKGSPGNAPSSGVEYAYQQIQYAAQAGADIINCSWIGRDNGSYPNSVVNYALSFGSLVIAGAGNSNLQHRPGNYWYPSDAVNSVSVAGVGQGDIKANFSDYGDPIDLTAPGVNIRSTVLDDAYSSSSGTSMSSPIVSGVAALVKTIHPDIAPLALKERLMMTTDFIEDVNNEQYIGLLGTGRVNAFKAVMFDVIPNLSLFEYSIEEVEGDGDGVPNPGEEISLTISLANEIDWMTARSVTATLTTGFEGVEILEELIQFPNIDGGSVVFNHNNPFRFVTAEDLSDLIVPFEITLRANPDNQMPYEKIISITVELSLQKAGWPVEISGSSTSSALLSDINRDGTMKIIFGDSQGNIHALREDKTYLENFPVNLGASINTAVAIADLTRDGFKEIVAHTQNGRIVAVDYLGNIVFDYNTGSQLRTNPMLVDINNSGRYEIVSLTFSNPTQLVILRSDGSNYPGFPISTSGPVMSSPAAVDLNEDGYKEIVFVTSSGNLHAVSPVTGEDIAGFPESVGSASWNGPVIADVSGDNRPDIILATIQGYVYAYNRGGNLFFGKQAENSIRSGVSVYDLNNDGQNEIIFADMQGKLYVVDNQGNDWRDFPVNLGAGTEASMILADMTGDGNQEILFGDNAGMLHSITIDGNESANFPIRFSGGLTVSPAIGYAVAGGNPALLLPDQNGYNYIDVKREIGEIGWSVFRGNERRSGNPFNLTSIEFIPEETLIQTRLLANYPNPFNPETSISFLLAENQPVRLNIYNIRGQLVNTLVDDVFSAGEHSLVWKGRDDKGQSVSSGVYFYTLETANHRSTRRMLLLK